MFYCVLVCARVHKHMCTNHGTHVEVKGHLWEPSFSFYHVGYGIWTLVVPLNIYLLTEPSCWLVKWLLKYFSLNLFYFFREFDG